jgi:hypothetical protein
MLAVHTSVHIPEDAISHHGNARPNISSFSNGNNVTRTTRSVHRAADVARPDSAERLVLCVCRPLSVALGLQWPGDEVRGLDVDVEGIVVLEELAMNLSMKYSSQLVEGVVSCGLLVAGGWLLS